VWDEGAMNSHVSGKKLHLLYIEDDKNLCFLFKGHLQEDGYTVDFALTAASGMEKFRAGSYFLVVFDYELPDQTGLKIAQELLLSSPLLPIIIVTGVRSE